MSAPAASEAKLSDFIAARIKKQADRFEDLEREEVEQLSPADRIAYSLYWVLKCQSSETWHHERNANGCLGCINTIDGALTLLAAEASKTDTSIVEELRALDKDLEAVREKARYGWQFKDARMDTDAYDSLIQAQGKLAGILAILDTKATRGAKD